MLFDDSDSLLELENLGREIISILVGEYRSTLLRFRKVATRKTFESIAGESDVTTNEVVIKIKANESLLFIISGRRKGAKLPVRKVGDRFELFPDLQEWKVAVGFKGNDYILARAISEKGIKGIPITDMVLEAVQDEITRLITERLARATLNNIANEIRQSFRQASV